MKPYYQDESVIIYNADCRDVLPTLDKVDLVLTDPPYGVLAETGSAATRRTVFSGNKTTGHMDWDIAPTALELDSVLSMGQDAAIWGGCHLELPPTYGYLIWDKQIDGLNFGEVEFCWTTGKFAPRIKRERAVNIDGGTKQPPTQKPISLMRWTAGFFPDAQTVLDPFMGSGTTLRAAKDLNRKAVGIELEEKYCEIAANRMSQLAMEL